MEASQLRHGVKVRAYRKQRAEVGRITDMLSYRLEGDTRVCWVVAVMFNRHEIDGFLSHEIVGPIITGRG